MLYFIEQINLFTVTQKNWLSAFFLQLFIILVYNTLKCVIRFSLSDEIVESIEQCYENINKFSFYLWGYCTFIRYVRFYVQL